MDDFLKKSKKVVCIVLYGLTISQSDCRKASPYQLIDVFASCLFFFQVYGQVNLIQL